jgi:hypothetical protein
MRYYPMETEFVRLELSERELRESYDEIHCSKRGLERIQPNRCIAKVRW